MTPKVLEIFDRVTVTEKYASALDLFEVETCSVDMRADRIDLYLNGGKAEDFLPAADTRAFIEMTKNLYGIKSFDIMVKYPGVGFSDEYFDYLMDAYLSVHDSGRAFLSGAEAAYENGALTVSGITGNAEILKNIGFESFMRRHMSYAFGTDVRVNLVFSDTDREEYLRRQEEIERSIEAEAAKAAPRPAKKPRTAKQFGKYIDEEPMRNARNRPREPEKPLDKIFDRRRRVGRDMQRLRRRGKAEAPQRHAFGGGDA